MEYRVSVKCTWFERDWPHLRQRSLTGKNVKTRSRFIFYETRFTKSTSFLRKFVEHDEKESVRRNQNGRARARRSYRASVAIEVIKNLISLYFLKIIFNWRLQKLLYSVISSRVYILFSTGHFLYEFITLACSFYIHPIRVLNLAQEKKRKAG